MMRFKIAIIACCFISIAQSIDQQLLIFVHTQSQDFGDEEGLNIAYQALTAIMQRAAPILMSENIWQHVVQRKDRFLQGLQNRKSNQSSVLRMHQDVNQLLKNNKGNVAVANADFNDLWYQQYYPQLSSLDQDSYKHLLFDYFCYYIFDYLADWKTYQLSQGYLLWIPHNSRQGFDLRGAELKDRLALETPIFLRNSGDLDLVLKKYMSKKKSIAWTFYIAGHGYHQDIEHAQAGVAGMALPSFKKLLKFFNDECSTKLFVYSSCFGAGKHAIIPYQDDNNNDLLLSYPIIIISLTDAPAYVFGVPSGLKLPPYNSGNFLTAIDVNRQGLQPYFLQNFNDFCVYAKLGKIDAMLAKTINPYIQCSFNNCRILKIENVPLIRRANSFYFIPLDGFQIYCVTTSQDQEIELVDKAACLWYVNRFLGTIIVSKKLPAFVSMIPGSQVHCIKSLKAQGFDFADLVCSLFLSIDDIQEQNMYLFDSLYCSVMIPEISTTMIDRLEHVLILPAGQWLPSFAQDGASCYVFVQYLDHCYCIYFDENQQITRVQKLYDEQIMIMKHFEQLLQQECELGHNKSIQTLLSSQHFVQRDKLQQDLLRQCLQENICKQAQVL